MESPATIDTRKALASLKSEVCPACGKPKKTKQSFCPKCFFSLSHASRRALYRLIGDGYELALGDAMIDLGAKTFYTDEDSQASTPR